MLFRLVFKGARSDGTTQTVLAPCSFKTRAHSFRVAPVVITSSTSRIRRPLKSPRHSKAPRTFLWRSLSGNSACGRRGAGAQQCAAVDRQFEAFSKAGSNFGRLVEAAFAQALTVQRQRHDQVDIRCGQGLQHLPGEPVGDSQLVAVLEGVNDAVHRKIVAETGAGPIEMRRLLQAGAAAFAVRCLFVAERAKGAGQRRQISLAVRTEQAWLRYRRHTAGNCRAGRRRGVADRTAGSDGWAWGKIDICQQCPR